MDRFEGMSIVLAVAEAGSLTAAARRRKMPLATVSRKVSELEAHLRTKLFNRSTRAFVPTDAGLSYIAAAKRILADVSEAERAVAGEYETPRGELSVSTLVALGRSCLQPILSEFLKTFPEVDVHLNLEDRTVNLLEEHIDVALRVGELADSSLIAVRVGEIHRVVCASAEYLESRGMPKSPDDLQAHDCISYPPMQSPSTWRFKRDRTDYVVPVRSRFVASNLESACDAARGGLGITEAFSYLLADSISSRRLIPLLQDFQPPPQPVNFVYSPNRFMPAKLRVFLDFAVPRLRERLAVPNGMTSKGGPRNRAARG
ncbi:LysR family transcriptional regulator [Bradyrhizobium sp. CCBAU 53421]|uniref:LysR family transcriptional regulator n=1 Tax=Bradyrhizobium sp. CCBAU 53421 TaxID=1325120 RepID=UPI00188DC68D|nr:LysR family transcriptional regulator [Bradyrhizobium sp. CCBAU 53421]QOZ30481.1 LysR family transcriptional regulator [Bradyrhizobium sp. CCBAU 53421]